MSHVWQHNYVDLYYGWPFIWKVDSLMLKDGGQFWTLSSSETAGLQIAANLICGIAISIGVLYTSTAVVRVARYRQFAVHDMMAYVLWFSAVAAYKVAEDTLAAAVEIGSWVPVSPYTFPMVVQWILLIGVGGYVTWTAAVCTSVVRILISAMAHVVVWRKVVNRYVG